MARERVLISVKTYPTLSSTYDEVVCTAGFREDSSWVRIYPVPFRKFDDYQRYSKFQWIELDLVKNKKDKRIESFRPNSEITLLDVMGRENDWYERRDFILDRGQVYTNLEDIIARNRAKELSLATFKPTRIIDVTVEGTEADWDIEKLDAVKQRIKQNDLFGVTDTNFKVVRKLPYIFRYEFEDNVGKRSKLMIEDWELGALYWRQFDKYKSENRAIEDVRLKYLHGLVDDKDTHLFLGTTSLWDARGVNPFVIIGVFAPPTIKQISLF